MKLVNSLYRLTHALKVLSIAKKNVSYLLKKGGSISSTQIVAGLKAYIPKLDVIIDVGANQGQFALAAADGYREAVIYSFEPIPDVFPTLVSNIERRSNITAFNHALGMEDGEISFYQNAHSHASSILKITEFQKSAIPQTSSQSVIQVEIKKLDSVFADRVIEFSSKKVLLKLDVQGYEKQVLLGSQTVLTSVDYVLLEVSFVHMYEGEPLFDEIDEFMKQSGYKLVAPVGYLQTDNLQIVQLDVLYKRNADAR